MLLRAALLAIAPLMLLGSAAAPAPAARPAPNWLDAVAATPEGGVRQGNPAAPIKLIEYGSRSCPTCGAFANSAVAELRAKYVATGKVSYEFRDFWIHNQDPGLSLLGHCVPVKAFFPILDAMFAEQASFNARVTDALFQRISKLPQTQQPGEWARALGYVEFMKRHGMPEAKANQCLSDTAALNRIRDRVQAASDAGIDATPYFILDGRKLDYVRNWWQLEGELRAAGA